MAQTNFAALEGRQKIVWSRDTWKAARDQMFIKKFSGTSENNVIQRITELTKTEKGEQVLMFLVADLVGDGVIGDSEREGNEEGMQSYDLVLNIDLISHGVRNRGKLSDQKTVIKFRENGRDRLAYWLANRVDQLAFLTMSGISYAFNNDGSTRSQSPFPNLAFAADVSAPSSARALMYDGTNLVPSVTANITNAYQLSYNAIVDAVAYAKAHYVKPLTAGGKEYYMCFLRPEAFAQLKKDQNYQRAVTTAAPRSADNPWFAGGTVTIDGLVFHEHRLVYNTKGAAGRCEVGRRRTSTAPARSSAVPRRSAWRTSACRSGKRRPSSTAASRASTSTRCSACSSRSSTRSTTSRCRTSASSPSTTTSSKQPNPWQGRA
jgi:N4-gp56 family major capsid protein